MPAAPPAGPPAAPPGAAGAFDAAAAFDWICASCAKINASSRSMCSKCQRPVCAACRLVTPRAAAAVAAAGGAPPVAAAVIIKLPFAPPPAVPAPLPPEAPKKAYTGPSIAEIRAAYQREQAAALGPPKHGKRPSAFLQPRYSTRSTAPPPPPKPEPEP